MNVNAGLIGPEASAGRSASPRDADRMGLAALCGGFLALALPLFLDLPALRPAEGLRGHEAAIFAVSGFLLYRLRQALAAMPAASSGARWCATALFAAGLALYAVGRALDLRLALLSLVVIVAAGLWHARGAAAVRRAWFALLFPVFALPLPLELVLALTGPLKTGVSATATWLLSSLGYPVGRSGVVMTMGQYQLLVTEACAGLQTMFTLEAMGLLYTSLTNHSSPLRNGLLAVLVVPIAFAANVVRVLVLALITYYFGNDAGQGFLHGFSGIVLFLAALVMVVAVDGLLGRLLPEGRR